MARRPERRRSRLRRLVQHHQTAALIVTGTAMLGLGVLIGVAIGRGGPVRPASPPPVAAGHSVPQPAAAVHPPAAVSAHPPAAVAQDDAPATETSQRTVVEDEPEPAAPQTALALPPAPPSPPAAQPAWIKYAVPSRPANGHPTIAVIIDDVGVDRKRAARVVQLPGPLTISVMSYAEEAERLGAEARAHGHEVMVHVPMEPMSGDVNPGPGALLDGLSRDEVRRRLSEDLDRVGGVVGINNHMGSKFTAWAPGMEVVMEELHRRGLLFVDSLTTDHSVGLALAQRLNVPAAGRNVFLDNAGDLPSVEAQLAKLEEVARKKGNAIAIGHPRDATIAALAAWLPTLRQKGLVLVPVTAVVRARLPMTAAAAHAGQ